MTLIARRTWLWLLIVVGLMGCGDGSKTGATASADAKASTSPSSAPVASQATSSAEPAATATAKPAESVPRTAGIFYRVTSPNPDTKPSYLLGTMHAGVDAEDRLPQEVFSALDTSIVMVLEVDALDLDPFEALKLAQLPPGKSVFDKLSPGRWEILVDRVGGLLMPESTLKTFKPWFLVALLTQDMLEKTDPMDLVLHRRAKEKQLKVITLETIPEQLTIIDKALDVKSLDDVLGDLTKTEELTKALAKAYLAGDEAELYKLALDPVEMKKHPKQFDDMLFGRNDRWLPKLEPLLKKGGVFVAVGAAHLVGDRGLVSGLRARKFELTRVAEAPSPAPPPTSAPPSP